MHADLTQDPMTILDVLQDPSCSVYILWFPVVPHLLFFACQAKGRTINVLSPFSTVDPQMYMDVNTSLKAKLIECQQARFN